MQRVPFDRRELKNKDNFDLWLHLIPEPFVGRLREAKLFLLGCNPAYRHANNAEHQDPQRRLAMLQNLWQRDDSCFYYFTPLFRRSSGFEFWSDVLGYVHATVAHRLSVSSDEAWLHLSTRVAAAELYGYRSHNGYPSKELRTLPTSLFTFSSLKDRLSDSSVQFVHIWKNDQRLRHWQDALCLSRSSPRITQTNMSAVLHPQTIGAERFEYIIERLVI